VQIVSGTKVSKITKGPVDRLVRYVNVITDISQHFIDICQYRYHYMCIGKRKAGEKIGKTSTWP
jgi:hypothetical protein